MRNLVRMLITAALAAALLAALAGCGGNSAAEPAEPAEESQETVVFETYTGNEGWSVKYDPALIEVREADGAVDFVYTGESGGDSMATVRCVADKQPEEVLYEVTSQWGDEEAVIRSEGFFPGTDDKWGFWRVLASSGDDADMSRTAIAGEYNGGVLLLENTIYTTGDDALDMAAIGALETIVDSISYESFADQTMFDYVPGVYSTEADGPVKALALREDHTGTLTTPEGDAEVYWGSMELTAADGSFRYEYTVEGDRLYFSCDDEWVELTK